MLKRLVFEEEGQTLVEYGLLLALLALVVVVAVTVMGKSIITNYNNSNNQLPLG